MRYWRLVLFSFVISPVSLCISCQDERVCHICMITCLNKGVSVRVARLFVLFWLLTQGLEGVSRDPWTDR